MKKKRKADDSEQMFFGAVPEAGMHRRKFIKGAAGAAFGVALGMQGATVAAALPVVGDGKATGRTGKGRSYYLSSSGGSDDDDGSLGAPWKTLAKISAARLLPGDTVYFKRGDRFDGHFVVNGSGSKAHPILITAYGEGQKPVLTGEVGKERGGDYLEAIYVNNHDHLMMDGLEVQNGRRVTRRGVDDTKAYGVHVHNTGNKVLRHFVLRNMTFRNVYAPKPMLLKKDFNRLTVSGVHFSTARNTRAGKEKNIQDVLVEHCYFTDIQRLGVYVNHEGGNKGVGNDFINRNVNIVVRKNEFHYLGGSSVLPVSTYNCLIEENLFDHPGSKVDPRMPGRGSSVWPYHCVNTVIQRNRCLGVRGYADSCGVHIDNRNANTFVQYNYMEHCEGGFVEILNGNVNSVYRYNVSLNDGWRKAPPGTGPGRQGHTIWIAANPRFHLSEGNYIYNNTVCLEEDFPTSIIIEGRKTCIYNNIFYSAHGGMIGGENVILKHLPTPLFMSNNLFYGKIDKRFVQLDRNPVKADPEFAGNGYVSLHFQLKADSPAINRGVNKRGPAIPGAGKGIFKHVPAYPTEDFYGNPVDDSSTAPNIGACNAKHGQLVSVLQFMRPG